MVARGYILLRLYKVIPYLFVSVILHGFERGSKGPRSLFSKIPMHGLDRDVLVQRLFSKFTTFRPTRSSIKKIRTPPGECHTDSALFLSTERNVVVQYVILVYPDLTEWDGD